MSSFARTSESREGRPAPQYDGQRMDVLARRWDVPAVHAFESVGSTLDVAHELAPGAATGTLVLADEQTAGRGRHGRRWRSPAGSGVWLTLIERPTDARALDVLAIRCGLFAAEALDDVATGTVGVKWPNDLYVDGRKLAGILIETRWRGTAPEWVAIGFGLNVMATDAETSAALRPGTGRLDALDRLVPALRRAAQASRHLSDAELARWRARDASMRRAAIEPAIGVVQGIGAAGELLIEDPQGRISAHRSGSLTFATPLTCS